MMRRGCGAGRLGGGNYAALAFSVLAACSSGSSGSGSGAAATATMTVPPTATVPQATPPPTATHTHSPVPTNTARPPTATHTVPPPTPTNTILPPTATNTVPAPTATPTPLIGPIVTAFGLADGMGTFDQTTTTDDEGRPLFVRSEGDGFVVYVEGRPGPSGLPVGTQRLNFRPDDPSSQPDLQIQATRDLGDGSEAVCDGAFPIGGGVPGVEPPDFRPLARVSDSMNDLACRFKVFAEKDFACTQTGNGELVFAETSSTVQFCTLISEALTFPSGDTVLSVRLRDTVGNGGPAAQIVVRIN